MYVILLLSQSDAILIAMPIMIVRLLVNGERREWEGGGEREREREERERGGRSCINTMVSMATLALLCTCLDNFFTAKLHKKFY